MQRYRQYLPTGNYQPLHHPTVRQAQALLSFSDTGLSFFWPPMRCIIRDLGRGASQ